MDDFKDSARIAIIPSWVALRNCDSWNSAPRLVSLEDCCTTVLLYSSSSTKAWRGPTSPSLAADGNDSGFCLQIFNHCSLCLASSSDVNLRPRGCLSLYLWISAWQAKPIGIALPMLSLPPSAVGRMWSVSIWTPQKRWQMQHRRWQAASRAETSSRSKAIVAPYPSAAQLF